jgi:hemoglobin
VTTSDYERIGGEEALRLLIGDFVDTVFGDVMIGFFFRNANRARIEEMEYQHAAEYLGADLQYQGRPLAQAHKAHPIMGGQFARRKQLLKEAMERHKVPDDIAGRWLEHTESLREAITGDPGDECMGEAAAVAQKDNKDD